MTAPAGQAMTVTGPIPADQLGITLGHEHLLIDLRATWEEPRDPRHSEIAYQPVALEHLGALRRDASVLRDNFVLDDLELSIVEARQFREAGGSTIVDVTCRGLGRQPAALREIAEQTGLNVVMGCGYYVASTHPDELSAMDVDEIAAAIVEDVLIGADGTGIRAGVIGEIGISPEATPVEQRVLRAAARAARQTGAPLVVHHIYPYRQAHAILDLIEAEGLAPQRVVLGHVYARLDDPDDAGYQVELAKRGVFLSYDTFGQEFDQTVYHGSYTYDRERIRGIRRLCDAGFAGQILVSHDVWG